MNSVNYFNYLPPDIMDEVFSYLTLDDHLNCREVCRKWMPLADKANKAILGKWIWKKSEFEILGNIPEMPKEYVEYLRTKEWLAVLIPTGISPEKIGELFKKVFPKNEQSGGYRFLSDYVKASPEYKKTIEKAYWVLIKKNAIQENGKTKMMSYSTAKEEIDKLEKEVVKNNDPLEVSLPKIVEVGAATLLLFKETGERLFKKDRNDEWNDTWCQETVIIGNKPYPTGFGNFEFKEEKAEDGKNFASGGPRVDHYYVRCGFVVARKFRNLAIG